MLCLLVLSCLEVSNSRGLGSFFPLPKRESIRGLTFRSVVRSSPVHPPDSICSKPSTLQPSEQLGCRLSLPLTWQSLESEEISRLQKESRGKFFCITKDQLLDNYRSSTSGSSQALPASLELLERDAPSFRLFLLGSNHIAKQSQNFLTDLMRRFHFSLVLVELCPERLESSIAGLRENFYKKFLLPSLLWRRKFYQNRGFFLPAAALEKPSLLFICREFLLRQLSIKDFVLELFSWLQYQAAELMETDLGGELLLPLRLAYILNNFSEDEAKGGQPRRADGASLLFHDEPLQSSEKQLEALTAADLDHLESQAEGNALDTESTSLSLPASLSSSLSHLSDIIPVNRRKKINRVHVLLADQFYSKTIAKLMAALSLPDKLLLGCLVALEIQTMVLILFLKKITACVKFVLYTSQTILSMIFHSPPLRTITTAGGWLLSKPPFQKVYKRLGEIIQKTFAFFSGGLFLKEYVDSSYNDQDFLESEIKLFKEKMSKISNILIDDRDRHLSDSVKQTLQLLHKKAFRTAHSYAKYHFDCSPSPPEILQTENEVQRLHSLPVEIQSALQSIQDGHENYMRDGYDPNENPVNILAVFGAGHMKGIRKNLLEDFPRELSDDHQQGVFLVDMDKLFDEHAAV